MTKLSPTERQIKKLAGQMIGAALAGKADRIDGIRREIAALRKAQAKAARAA